MSTYASISRNLIAGLGLTIVFVGFTSIGIYYFIQMDRGKRWLDNIGTEYAVIIGNALQFPLWNLNAESITSTANAYANNDLIVFLSVKDAYGGALFYYNSTDDVSISKTHRFNVKYGGTKVGSVELALTDLFIKQQSRQILFFGISLILISFLCLALMAHILLKRFLRGPLNNLKCIAREYAAGNFQTKAITSGYIEFNELTSVLADMGKTIESQIAERQQIDESLKKHRDHLEDTVIQRTSELNANKQHLEAILKSSPIGIGLVIDRRLGWANETMYQMVGYEKDTLIGKNARILYSDQEEYERVSKELYSGIIGKERSIETQWARQDGTTFDCSIRTCYLDPADPSKGQIVTVSDTSKAKLLETKLQRAEKMEAIGTMAGGVAHDLNNILSGIVSYPELLLLDMAEDNPLHKPLLTIQKSGEKAVNIVQDLLTMARRGVSITEVVNLNQVISEQLQSPEMERLLLFHSEVKVISNLSEDLLNVKGSPTHLSKSIMNLLSNAAEAMDTGGIITISSSNLYLDTAVKKYELISEGDYVTVTVSDTGTGISQKDFQKIFEPFYTKKSMDRSGTGLGMAVVWGTMKDHNGYIDIESSKGEGTTLTLYLPVTREHLQEKTAGFSLDQYKGKRESILVIDDIEEQREIATVMLEKLGYLVSSVSSGKDAISYMKNNSADLLVLDMIMEPGIDGLETYKHILSIHPGQKAVIASGFSRTDRVKELQKLGAGQYIKKPYTLRKIGFAVKEELNSGMNS